MRNLRFILTGFIIFWLTGCKEVVDFYLGIPLQPVIDEDSFVPGLNIFGIIRPDSNGDYNNSCIMLQKVIPAVGSSDSLDVGRAVVRVERLNEESCLYDFLLTDYGHLFSQEAYRPDTTFSTKAGDIFTVECVYHELPVLKAMTIVPNPPVMLMNTLTETGNSISFEVQAEPSIFMLDIYVYAAGELAGYERLPAEQSVNTLVFLPYLQGLADSIDLYSYDSNMADYYTTANTSLNFNKYRESFSTVENGYGVFGSMNHTRFYLK